MAPLESLQSSQTHSKFVGSTESARDEAERTESGRTVGRATGLFDVPAVLSYSDGWIVTQHMPDIRALRSWLHWQHDERLRLEMMARVGGALGSLHALARVSTQPAAIASRWHCSDVVAIHGDFGLTNVQVSTDGRITILDCAAPAWAPPLGCMASSHWDLALLLVDLHYQRPRDPLRIDGTRHLARAFLDGYRGWREVDLRSLRGSTAAMTYRYYRSGEGMRRALRLPSSTSLLL